jgi:hypothetical protein
MQPGAENASTWCKLYRKSGRPGDSAARAATMPARTLAALVEPGRQPVESSDTRRMPLFVETARLPASADDACKAPKARSD